MQSEPPGVFTSCSVGCGRVQPSSRRSNRHAKRSNSLMWPGTPVAVLASLALRRLLRGSDVGGNSASDCGIEGLGDARRDTCECKKLT